MSDVNVNGLFMNYLLSALYKKVVVPTDFHGQADAVKQMLRNDVSGIVDALTDFAVESASVDYNIKTSNETLNQILKVWLQTVNSDFNGQIPSGIGALSEEYFKERWKGASFPILKIMKWDTVEGFMVPTQMAFVDGCSVFSKDIEDDDQNVNLLGYEYYLGKGRDPKDLLGKNCIITKPFGRWHDEYPSVYLIKRGVYMNWSLIRSLKEKENEILDQVIPYMLLVKKGSESLAVNKGVNYDDAKLKAVIGQFEELITKMQDYSLDGQKKSKTPIRASQFDETVEHMIPDLKTIFQQELFTVLEKHMLAGLGFIDVADATSSSRKESILNPKAFVTEINAGVKHFKQILSELVILIQSKNANRPKYINSTFRITSSPVKPFMSAEFKDQIKAMYDRGRCSTKLYVEVCGEANYEEQLEQRNEESKKGIEYLMYPPVITNQEDKAQDFSGKTPTKSPQSMDAVTTEDKINPADKKNFNKASIIEGLEGAPYSKIGELPENVKEHLKTPKERRLWLSTFNSAYHFYLGKFGDAKKAETLAHKTAWAKAPKN